MKVFIPPFLCKAPFGVPYWNAEEIQVIRDTRKADSIIVGDSISECEADVCRLVGARYSVATDLGRTAIELALHALGLGKKDEVIVPTFICGTAVRPVIQLGCKPVFADIDLDLNINPDNLGKYITKKTRAILVAHMGGKLARMQPFIKIAQEKDLYIIEDAAQALGAKFADGTYAGTKGDVGIYSFGLGKNLIATGGGMLVTNSDEIYHEIENIEFGHENKRAVIARASKIRFEYKNRRYTWLLSLSKRVLRNRFEQASSKQQGDSLQRMSNLDAALLRVQLKKVDEIIKKRQANSRYLIDHLNDNPKLELPEYSEEHIFTKFTITINNGNELRKGSNRWPETLNLQMALLRRGIEIEWPYVPVHIREEFEKVTSCELPIAESLWWKLINLPVNPTLGVAQMEYIADRINEIYVP